MGDLQRIRQRFFLAAGILGAINLALLVYLLWPGARQTPKEVLQQQKNSLQRDVERWKLSDPAKTREDLKQFYAEDVPSRWSRISQQMEKLIQETGVTAGTIHYSPEASEKTSLPDVQMVKIDTTVTGDYAKVAGFINAMEREKPLFIIEKISLSSQEGGKVSLQITFDAFLKQTA